MNLSRKVRTARYLLAPRRLLGRIAGPRVLMVSVPKAGTNLLRNALDRVPQLRSGGQVVGSPSEYEDMLSKVARLRRGQFLTTHLHWSPDAESLFDQVGVSGLFLIRDPRDVAVSHYHYIMREPGHWCHSYFHSTLQTQASRLAAVIAGLKRDSTSDQGVTLFSIDQHFRCRLRYLADPRFLTLRFEDLIGPQGGGTRAKQELVLAQIATHLGLRLTDRDIDRMANGIFSPDSPTFRKGTVGSWEEELTDDHTVLFKETAGQLLIDLGYESDFDW